MYNIRTVAIRHDFIFDSNSNVFSISHRLRDIRKRNCTKFDLEKEDQGQGEKK